MFKQLQVSIRFATFMALMNFYLSAKVYFIFYSFIVRKRLFRSRKRTIKKVM